jgi:hypothetical protein
VTAFFFASEAVSFALALVEDDPAAAAPVVAAPGAADVGPVEGVFVDAGAAGSAVFCPVEPDCDSGTETALVELPPVPLLSVVLSEPEFQGEVQIHQTLPESEYP